MLTGATIALKRRTRAAPRAMVDRVVIAALVPFSDGTNCHATMGSDLSIFRRIPRQSRLAKRIRARASSGHRRPRRDDCGPGRAPARRHLAGRHGGRRAMFRRPMSQASRPVVSMAFSKWATARCAFPQNVSAPDLRRVGRDDASQRRRRRARRGPQDAHDSALHPPRARRTRHGLSLSGLHVSKMRRPSPETLHPNAHTTRAGGPGWSDGGATRLDNLVLLCRRHHRAVHEGGFAVIRGHNGVLTLLRPDGAPLQVAPASPFDLPGGHHALPNVTATLPTWDGTRFDLAWAIDLLYRGPVVPKNLDLKKEEGCGRCGNRSVVSTELVGALPA